VNPGPVPAPRPSTDADLTEDERDTLRLGHLRHLFPLWRISRVRPAGRQVVWQAVRLTAPSPAQRAGGLLAWVSADSAPRLAAEMTRQDQLEQLLTTPPPP
jgi:hypothetical protein